MNGQELIDRVRTEAGTALDRLGSDKAMIAATGADLATDPVLAHVAGTLAGLRSTTAEWADATDDEDAAALFAATAESAGEEYERVVDAMDGDPAGDGPAVVTALDGLTDAPARVGGLVGQSLAFDRTLLQVVNFFVNEAAEGRADLIRDVRAAANNRVDEGAVVLDAVCTEAADWDAAEAAAVAVVDAGYEEYVDALDALGIDPKPVC